MSGHSKFEMCIRDRDNRLYVIFESAGEKYLEGTDGKGNSPAPIDKILRINTDVYKRQIRVQATTDFWFYLRMLRREMM